jgi:polar amino acid transport system substrate-binding protein
MRRAAFYSLLIVLSLVLSACAAGQQATGGLPEGPVTDLGGREVSIFVENAYPPFNLIDEATNEGAGWDYDVWREICRRLNCTPVFVEAGWPPFEMLTSGEVDVAADGITLTFPRSLAVDFSDPYIEYGQVMLIRSDSPWTTEEEFAADESATVGAQPGTTNEALALKLVGEARTKGYAESPIAVEALLAGDIDGTPLDEVATVEYLKQHPDKLKSGFYLTSGELLSFAFPAGSTLIGSVNWAIQEMINDGTMDEYCETWLLRKCSPELEE